MDTNTLIERLVGDYEFCLETPEEFIVGTGKSARVSTTAIMRTVAALNVEATRAQFVQAMVRCGVNVGTAAKQFGISRQLTIADEPTMTMRADGSIEE